MLGNALGGMKVVFGCTAIGMNVKIRLYEGVPVPTAPFGAETWIIAVAEIKCNGDELSDEYVWSNAYGLS